MTIFAILGILQNSLYLIIFIKSLIPPTQTNRIFALLAFSDLLTSMLVAPLHAVQAFNDTFARHCFIDAVRVHISALLISASTYFVCLLSYDTLTMLYLIVIKSPSWEAFL